MRTTFVVSALAFIAPALSAPTVVPISKRAGPIVPGSYIVKFKDGSLTENAWSKFVKALLPSGSSVTYDYRSLMPACALKLNDAALVLVQRMSQVEYIEQDSVMSLSEHEDDHISFDLASPAFVGDDVLARRADSTEKKGEGVLVYGIDTGIYIEHNEFGGRASRGANFVGDGNDDDGNGHGTHTAATAVGTKYGVASDANIIAVKVLGADGSGATSGVIAGIQWAYSDFKQKGMPAIATMSLGGILSKATNDAVQKCIDGGLHFTVAAGNDGLPADFTSPASVKAANTIGAVDSHNNNQMASFSNYGQFIDLWAPGVNIESAWIGDVGKTKTISGTSMATPYVAGVAAVILSRCPKKLALPANLSQQLKDHAKDKAKFDSSLGSDLIGGLVTPSAAGLATPNKGIAAVWDCSE